MACITEAFLKKGEDVVATGRNKLLGKKLEEMGAKFVELDITQKEDFSKLPTENVSGVILLAGLLPANAKADLEANENAADYFKINVIGAINVLEYCRKNKIKKLLETVVIVMCLGHGEKDIPLRRMNQGISSLKEIMPFM